jgi:transmembrane sensor
MSAMGDEPASVAARLAEASEWLVRLQQRDVTEAEVAAWLKWCAVDHASLAAFERVQLLYDQLHALPPTDKNALVKLQPIVAADNAAPGIYRRWRTWGGDQARLLVAGVAAVSIAAVLVIAGAHGRSPLTEAHDYEAPRGLQQSLQLADRSQITLASKSEVLSHFTPTTRYVDLRRGEAYFEVQHDRSRPFVVKAGAMTVTAVGTKFDVRTSGARTVVAVTEGAVDVTTDEPGTSPSPDAHSGRNAAETITSPLRLRAGQQAVREAGRAGLTVVDIDAAAATSWRAGRLEYVMEPLSGVVDDVNRYAAHHIVIQDPSLGKMIFTGTIFIDRVDEWAMTLSAALPVSTSLAADGTVALKSLAANTPRTDFR